LAQDARLLGSPFELLALYGSPLLLSRRQDGRRASPRAAHPPRAGVPQRPV